MAKKKTVMQLIPNSSTRRSTFKKRKASLIKKTRELSTLCGVPACIVVYGSDDPTPDMWPPQEEEVARIISRFYSIPEAERAKKTVDQISLLSKQLEKRQSQLRQLEYENRRLAAKLSEIVGTRLREVTRQQSVGPSNGLMLPVTLPQMVADVAPPVEGRFVFDSVGTADVASSMGDGGMREWGFGPVSADVASLPVGPEVEDEISRYLDGSDFGFDEEMKALLSQFEY